jgi:molecular chaperone DnaK (HSP70)
MNTDIDENDCIVIRKGGSEVGKRGVGLVGSKDPADASASAPSLDVGERAEDSRGGWAMVTRRQAKAGGTGNNSSLTAKLAKVFASTSELERKQKAE